MEAMYQEFKDLAEIRLIYIKEAHAADSNWPMRIAREKGINEHQTYEERCATADMMLADKELSIPVLVDEMNDAVNQSYSALPDRVFVVDVDGTIAVAADRGPRGFEPGLNATRRWLVNYRREKEKPTATKK